MAKFLKFMKFSIITVCLNADKTIEKTINSVINQDYKNIEYIVIDGCSEDNTINILKKFKNNIDIILIEKDDSLYDAINKGIKMATGEIIGILNSDDHLNNNKVISNIANEFNNNHVIDAVIGGVVFYKNGIKKRVFNSIGFKNSFFKFGMMPPHPTFYAKKILYDKYGLYNTKYKISSDFDLLLRFFLIHNVNYKILNFNFVNMQMNGISTKNYKSNILLNQEILDSLKRNNISSNYILIYMKYFIKIFQYIIKYEK